MTQNTSHAVMAQRAEPNDSLDYFPTPPWATRALCEYLTTCDPYLHAKSVWEPACGEGHMAVPLSEYFDMVYSSDVHPYGFGAINDFLLPVADKTGPTFDWIISNPPFRLGMEFALTMIERARYGAAILVRTAFLEGGERFRTLFQRYKPHAVMQFCERVPMVKGRYDPKASTATSYCWIVWRFDSGIKPGPGSVPMFLWIPPCRSTLERPADSMLARAA